MNPADLAFQMDSKHTRLLTYVVTLEEAQEEVPPILNEVLEFMAQAQVILHILDNENHRTKGQALNKVLLSDCLQVMTMLHQAVYDGKVLMQHDTKRIRDVIMAVDTTIQSLPKVIQLGYD